jgi:GNAT superfamily N-acetyltransferase
MGGEARVREAGVDDAERVYRVLMRAFEEYDGQLDPPSGVYSETVASLAEKVARGEALLCEADGRAVGCAFCTPEPDYLYVGRFGVLPEYRGAGVGALLLGAAEERAAKLGYSRVRLNVRVILEGLRGYYERHGYRTIAFLTHEGYPGPTYVQMEKVLARDASSERG